VYQTGFISHVLSALVNLSPSKVDPAKQQTAVRLITDILLTWPGLIWFGFRTGLLQDLLRLMPRYPDAVLGVLSKILNFEAPPLLIDGFVGFALAGLLPMGLVSTLSAVSDTHAPTADFLSGLMPYIPSGSAPYVSSPRPAARRSGLVADVPVRVSTLAHAVGAEGNASSIAQFTLPQEPDAWPWMAIRRFLTVVLPSDPAELNPPDPGKTSPPCKPIVLRLLDYFAAIPSDSKIDPLKEECLLALVSLLVENSGVISLLEKHEPFRRAIEHTVQNMAQKSYSVFTRCVGLLLCSAGGCNMLCVWGLVKYFWKMGEACKSPAIAAQIASLFVVPRIPQNTVGACLCGLLRFASPEVFVEVMSQIRRMQQVVENFDTAVFAPVISNYINADFPGVGNPRRELFISLLSDILTTHRPSLALAAADPHVHVFLRQNCRPLQGLLFGHPTSVTRGFLDEEITWWMETGNTQYVSDFQAAVNAVHGGATARFPPHLFGQVAKNEEGRVAAKPFIPQLVKLLQPGPKQVGALFALAHFASDRQTHDVIENAGGFVAMIDVWQTQSFETKGNVIAAFALISPSRTFKSALSQSDWQLFAFGGRSAAFPCDLNDLPPETIYQPPAPVDDSPGDQARAFVRQLSSSITLKKGKEGIENLDEEKKTELAPFAFTYLSRFFVTPDGRDCLMRALASIPVIQPQQRPAADIKASATIAAKIFVAAKTRPLQKLTEVAIPTVPLAKLDATNACQRAAELFVSDSEFTQWSGLTKAAFWALPEKKIRSARRALMQHKPFSS
jgi:hypothetical protein